MAAVAKSGTPSVASPTPTAEHVTVGRATEDIAAGDACYLFGTIVDGLPTVTRATGVAANAAAVVEGFAAAAASSGEPVTLYREGVHMHYGSGLTPGAGYFLSGAVAGGLDTAASTGGTLVIARAINASVIRVIGNL
jgi:hypothetical protein